MKRYLLSILLGLSILLSAGFFLFAAAETQGAELDPFMKATLLSGPTNELPWENEPDFQASKEQSGCNVLLGAYKTVLHDPLPGEEYNVHLAASYISGTVLDSGETFSQNRKAGPYTKERGFQEGPTYLGTTLSKTIGGGVCKISSTLFNTVVLSDLQIVERHTHSMPVPYVPYGQDATVSYGAKDFRFRNNTDGRLLLMARGIENVLYIGLYGKTAAPEVEWNHEVLRVEKAPVLSKVNTSLPANTERMVHEGMDGAVIKSFITLRYPDGTVKTKDFGKCHYKPLPFIKEVSTN